MELRHLRYFIRAAQVENFTKAAESLYVSQPTLSVQIHQLEQELGAELFARSGRNVKLTEAGRVFLNRAEQAVRELEEGGKEVDAIAGVVRGHLTVGALPMLGSKLVSHWFTEFNERYPLIRLHGKSCTTEDLDAEVLNGTIDIGFGIAPSEHPEVHWRDLFSDDVVLIVSKKHPLASKKNIEIDDLRNVPLAMASSRVSSTQSLGRFFDQHKLEPRIEFTYDDGHALLEIVRRGKHVTFLPGWAAVGYDDLVAIHLPHGGIPISGGALWLYLSPAAKAFLEIAAERTDAILRAGKEG